MDCCVAALLAMTFKANFVLIFSAALGNAALRWEVVKPRCIRGLTPKKESGGRTTAEILFYCHCAFLPICVHMRFRSLYSKNHVHSVLKIRYIIRQLRNIPIISQSVHRGNRFPPGGEAPAYSPQITAACIFSQPYQLAANIAQKWGTIVSKKYATPDVPASVKTPAAPESVNTDIRTSVM